MVAYLFNALVLVVIGLSEFKSIQFHLSIPLFYERLPSLSLPELNSDLNNSYFRQCDLDITKP